MSKGMFNIYKTILQVMKHRKNYEAYSQYVPKKSLDENCEFMLDLFGMYFRHIQSEVINVESLCALMIQENHAPEKVEAVSLIFKTIEADPEESEAEGILKKFSELRYAADLSELILNYENGKEVDIYEDSRDLLEKFEAKLNLTDVTEASDRLDDVLKSVNGEGSRFTLPLKCLQGSANNLHTKTQMVIGARVDKGKTSLCAFLGTHFAKQTDRPIMILNNEDSKEEWMGSIYRNALGLTVRDMLERDKTDLQAQYDKVIGHGKIKIFDVHDRHISYAERLIIKHKPAVVFWDMLSNFDGFNLEAREDIRLEKLYQKARNLSIRHDFLSIPTVQLNGFAEGQAFPDLSMMRGSTTGIQGACKAILMMGSLNEPDKLRERYFSFVKNKFTQDPGVRKDCREAAYFEWETGRFHEV